MVSLVTLLSSPSSPPLSTTFRNLQPIAFHLPSSSSSQFTFPTKPINPLIVTKWRTKFSFFLSFLKKKGKSSEEIKEELFEAIAPLDRGVEATPEDQERIDQIARKLEAVGSIKEPLKSDLINGKWELIYTTSGSILKSQRPKFLRPTGKIYQAINADTQRAQNMETWPFFNQAIGDLIPLNSRKVAVKWDKFIIAGLIPIKAPDRPVGSLGQLEITYLDEGIRVSRGNRGNLFILKMVDPSYRIPD